MKTSNRIISLLLAVLLTAALLSGCSLIDSKDPNAGVYNAYAAEVLGVSTDVKNYFPDGFSIELKGGGRCKIVAGKLKANGKWSLEGNEITIKGGGLTCSGALENNRIRLTNVMDLGVDITLVKEGEPEIAEVYYIQPTTPNFAEAIANATHTQSSSSSAGFLFGDWYGYIKLTNSWGYTDNSDEIYDVTGIISTYSDSERPFFELYMDDVDGAILSFFLDIYDEYISADIGDEDAWFMNRYLTADESFNFSTGLYNGKLIFYYDYTDPDGENAGFTAEICLRKYGELWDSSTDTLPPGYNDYLNAIGG